MMCMLISGCATDNYYGKLSTAPDYQQPASVLQLAFNMAQHSAYSVPKADRNKHEQCVFFALDTMQLGERCDWYSNNGSTKGSVQIVAVRPQESGHCFTLYNSVFHKNRIKNWQDTACNRGVNNQWEWTRR